MAEGRTDGPADGRATTRDEGRWTDDGRAGGRWTSVRAGGRTSAGDSNGEPTLALFPMRRQRAEPTQKVDGDEGGVDGEPMQLASREGDGGGAARLDDGGGSAGARAKKKGKRAGKQAGMSRNARKWLQKQKRRGQDG